MIKDLQYTFGWAFMMLWYVWIKRNICKFRGHRFKQPIVNDEPVGTGICSRCMIQTYNGINTTNNDRWIHESF